jgi:hypothetical protein
LKGKKKSAEHNAKVSATMKKKAGKPQTVESRRKISEANKGRKVSAEHASKISATLKGRRPTLEVRSKRAEKYADATGLQGELRDEFVRNSIIRNPKNPTRAAEALRRANERRQEGIALRLDELYIDEDGEDCDDDVEVVIAWRASNALEDQDAQLEGAEGGQEALAHRIMVENANQGVRIRRIHSCLRSGMLTLTFLSVKIS